MNTDADWENLGKNDPYFGVLTHEKFRTQNIDQAALQEFFDSGEAVVNRVFSSIYQHVDKNFRPKRALEFGCGTGRLLIPTTRRVDEVVGLDVSSSMLAECEKNCQKFNIKNFTLIRSDDDLSCLKGEFDFIYSYIVFQHIPTERGKIIFDKLLDHLSLGGVCAIHVNYAKEIQPGSYGDQFSQSNVNPLKTLINIVGKYLYRYFHFIKKEPIIQMNTYIINDLLHKIQKRGIYSIHVEVENHGGELGAFLFFKNFDKKYGHLLVNGTEDREFIEECYNFILNRASDEGGFKYYLDRLVSGQITRNQLIAELANSSECKDKSA